MTERDGCGIRAVGAYAPRLRIDADEFADAWGRFEAPGIERKAVPEADEDALTMANEAARRALAAVDADSAGSAGGTDGADGADVDFLAVASTTPPLAEEDLTVRLGSMLGVPDGATRHVFTGSTRAGTRALVAGLDAAPDAGVVVAADCPRGEPDDEREHAAGAGAAAFVLGPDAPVTVEARAEHASPYPGTRFRRTGSGTVEDIDVTSYDRQAFTEPLAGAVETLAVDLDVDAAAVQAPDGELPYRGADALGVDRDAVRACATVRELGDTGAASVPLSVGRALADGHERVLAAAWGSGAGADALLLSVDAADEGVPAALALDGSAALSYAEYLRRRGDVTGGRPEGGGAYVSVPSWRRTVPQRHRLVAGRCPDCDALAFPPEGACPGCGALVDFASVELPGEGTVEARTRISRGGAPPEFDEQQARSGEFGVALVALDGPAESDDPVSVPAQVVPGRDVAVGDRVEAVVRRVYTQEGVTRYGFKVQPSE